MSIIQFFLTMQNVQNLKGSLWTLNYNTLDSNKCVNVS